MTSLFVRILVGAQWASVLGLWLSVASQYVSPVTFRYMSVMGLAFPVLFVGTAFLLVTALLFARRTAWIAGIGLLTCVMSVRRYFPVNFPSPPPKQSLKILTYNTMQFGAGDHDERDRNSVAVYMANSGADIICFQEGHASWQEWKKFITPVVARHYPYRDTVDISSGNNLGCFSKYPIVGREIIYTVGLNSSVAFKVELKQGDTLLVVNNHFASNKLDAKDRSVYQQLVKDPENAPVKTGIRQLVAKVTAGAYARALQADSVARYVAAHRNNYSVVVCGDFNDTPISYSRHRMAEGLIDAYEATGQGVGRSFNRDAIYVRIDNMMCSPDLRPYGARVDNSITASDHYPLYAHFQRKEKKN